MNSNKVGHKQIGINVLLKYIKIFCPNGNPKYNMTTDVKLVQFDSGQVKKNYTYLSLEKYKVNT